MSSAASDFESLRISEGFGTIVYCNGKIYTATKSIPGLDEIIKRYMCTQCQNGVIYQKTISSRCCGKSTCSQCIIANSRREEEYPEAYCCTKLSGATKTADGVENLQADYQICELKEAINLWGWGSKQDLVYCPNCLEQHGKSDLFRIEELLFNHIMVCHASKSRKDVKPSVFCTYSKICHDLENNDILKKCTDWCKDVVSVSTFPRMSNHDEVIQCAKTTFEKKGLELNQGTLAFLIVNDKETELYKEPYNELFKNAMGRLILKLQSIRELKLQDFFVRPKVQPVYDIKTLEQYINILNTLNLVPALPWSLDSLCLSNDRLARTLRGCNKETTVAADLIYKVRFHTSLGNHLQHIGSFCNVIKRATGISETIASYHSDFEKLRKLQEVLNIPTLKEMIKTLAENETANFSYLLPHAFIAIITGLATIGSSDINYNNFLKIQSQVGIGSFFDTQLTQLNAFIDAFITNENLQGTHDARHNLLRKLEAIMSTIYNNDSLRHRNFAIAAIKMDDTEMDDTEIDDTKKAIVEGRYPKGSDGNPDYERAQIACSIAAFKRAAVEGRYPQGSDWNPDYERTPIACSFTELIKHKTIAVMLRYWFIDKIEVTTQNPAETTSENLQLLDFITSGVVEGCRRIDTYEHLFDLFSGHLTIINKSSGDYLKILKTMTVYNKCMSSRPETDLNNLLHEVHLKLLRDCNDDKALKEKLKVEFCQSLMTFAKDEDTDTQEIVNDLVGRINHSLNSSDKRSNKDKEHLRSVLLELSREKRFIHEFITKLTDLLKCKSIHIDVRMKKLKDAFRFTQHSDSHRFIKNIMATLHTDITDRFFPGMGVDTRELTQLLTKLQIEISR